MKKRKIQQLLLLLVSVCFLVTIFPTWDIKAEEQASIRVGFIELKEYAEQEEDGTYAGVDVELTYQISQIANLRTEVVLYDNVTDALNDLNDGKLDCLSGIFKSDERQEEFLFSEREISNMSVCVFTKNDDDRYSYNENSQLNGMKMGVERNGYVKDIYQNWCNNRGYQTQLIEYDSLNEIKNAIDAGEIDGGLYGATSLDGYKTISRIQPQPYYYIFTKDNLSLKNKFDDALGTLITQEPLYQSKLIKRYVDSRKNDMEELTNVERKYIEENPLVRVAVIDKDNPYYFKDSDGNMHGIIPDFYEDLAQKTGLHFVYQEYASDQEINDAIANGEADVIGVYSAGKITAYNSDFCQTSTYYDADIVMITFTGMQIENIKNVAVKKRSQVVIQSALKEKLVYSDTTYENSEDCFTALQEGKVEAMLCMRPTAEYYVNQNYPSRYNITTIASESAELTGALAYDNTMLCNILSKAIQASSYRFSEIITNNALPANDLKTAINRLSPEFFCIVLSTLVGFVIVLLCMIFVIVRHQKEKNILLHNRAENDRREIELTAAENKSKEMNQFFSNISHDMRTPLNAIIGFSDLAYNTEGEEAKEYLEKIKVSSKLLNEMINDTLTIAKINSGKMKLLRKPINTKDICTSVYIPIQDMAKKKGIHFVAYCDEFNDRWINVDSLQLEKVLLNLLTNAVKYTPEGGNVLLSAKVESESDKEIGVKFEVKDDGVGISKKFLPHIYDPFVQEERSAETQSGTGLGLSIVKKIVEIMNGTIEVESEKDVGTTFILHLQFEIAEKQETLEPKKLFASINEKKILVVEDNQLNREIVVEILRKLHAEVDCAINGEDCLEKYEASSENYYDVILMDVRMPVMNGLDAARAIRESVRKDSLTVPIIAMTANTFEEDVKQCLDAGMNAHVAKPIDPGVMLQTIAMYIKEKFTS